MRRLINEKRNERIEALRIIACIFVVCIHLSLGCGPANNPSKSATFLACVRADAVAIFFTITGAFFFSKNDYKKTLHTAFNSIFLPMLVVMLFLFFFDGAIFEGLTVAQSINRRSLQDLLSILRVVFIEWNSPVAYMGQTWYIYVYLVVCLVFPLLYAFRKSLSSKSLRVFYLVVLGILLWNDFSRNRFGGFAHHTFEALFPAAAFILLGSILYDNREKLKEQLSPIALLITFVMVNALRTLIYIAAEKAGSTENTIMFWYSSFGWINATALFSCAIICEKQVNKIIRPSILLVGSCTFYVYLIHEIVIAYYEKLGILPRLRLLAESHPGFISQILYYTSTGLAVFGTSLVISLMVKILIYEIGKLVQLISGAKK